MSAPGAIYNGLMSKPFAIPEALVTTEWLAAHLADPNIRIVESNEDPLLYSSGHIPGAVNIDWVADLNDPLRRDYLNSKEFADDIRGFDPKTIVSVETTLLRPTDSSPLT